MEISLLAALPTALEPLVPEIYQHWQQYGIQETLLERQQKLETHLQTDKLPMAWIAHEGDGIMGIIALRTHDLAEYQQLSPWLGGLFVMPQYRQRGVGERLCQHLEHYAFNTLKINTLYLFTINLQAWYQSLGWSEVEPCLWQGNQGTVMKKIMTIVISKP